MTYIPDRKNVISFSAKGDGVTDDATAIQRAIDLAERQGGGVVQFPSGVFKCTAELHLKDGVFLRGAGPKATTLDFSSASAGTVPHRGCIYASGTLTELPALSQSLSIGDTVIHFDSDPSLEENDIVFVYNTTTQSFNTGKDDWHAGEMFVVWSTGSNHVTASSPSFDDYITGSNIKMYKLNAPSVQIEGLSIIGPDITTISNIFATDVRDCHFENIRGLNSPRVAGVELRRAYNTTILNVDTFDNGSNIGLNYGVVFGNSQRALVAHCRGHHTRHCFATGGSAEDGSVVCREIIVTDCVYTSVESSAANWHGNTEACVIKDSILIGGVDLQGHRNSIIDNKIYATDALGGMAIQIAQLTSIDHDIVGNKMYATTDLASPATNGLIKWDRASETLAINSGTLSINGNYMDMGSFEGNPIYLISRTSQHISVAITDNFIRRAEHSIPSTGEATVTIRGLNGSAWWEDVVIDNNTIRGTGINVNRAGARMCSIQGNEVINSSIFGIRVLQNGSGSIYPWNDSSLIVSDNVVTDPFQTGIYLQGNGESKRHCKVHDNVAVRTSQQPGWSSGNSSLNSSIYLQLFDIAEFYNNTIGDNQDTPTQLRDWAAFNVGVLYEGSNRTISSPALAVNLTTISKHIAPPILADLEVSGNLLLEDGSSLFVGGTTVSPNTDGATSLGTTSQRFGTLNVLTASISGPTSGAYHTTEHSFSVTSGDQVFVPWQTNVDSTSPTNLASQQPMSANGRIRYLRANSILGQTVAFGFYASNEFGSSPALQCHFTSSVADNSTTANLIDVESIMTGTNHFEAGQFIALTMSGGIDDTSMSSCWINMIFEMDYGSL